MSKYQILVVEDDAPVRNLITTTLKARDYRFITTGTGEGAVMEAASHNPDIVLLDLGLPDLDGVEVIRRPPAGNTKTAGTDAERWRGTGCLSKWLVAGRLFCGMCIPR